MLGSLSRLRADQGPALTKGNPSHCTDLLSSEHPDPMIFAANGSTSLSSTTPAREPVIQVLAVTSHTLVTQQTGSPAAPPQDVVMSWAGGARSAPDGADGPIFEYSTSTSSTMRQ